MRARAWIPFALVTSLVFGAPLTGAQAPAFLDAARPNVDRPNLDAIAKINEEANARSQIMDVLSFLTDVYGPRLTGSPNLRAAADYAATKLTEWGIHDPRLEPWGPFGRGWTNERFSAHVVEPQAYPLIGYPLAWTPGTPGTITGEAVVVTMTSESDFDAWRGKLKGAFVFISPLRDVRASFQPLARRFDDEDLETLSRPPPQRTRPRRQGTRRPSLQAGRDFARRRLQFFLDEEAAAVVTVSGRGEGGTVFATAGNLRNDPDAAVPPQIVLAVEHYGRIVRTLEKGIPVTMEVNVRNTFYDEANSFNVLGDIPGTDRASELVMIGAHLDSWHTGTGATDNAAGAAVMMEVMRILEATDLQMRRTVRLGLWSGEEHGFLGSRAYVKEHLADRSTQQKLPAHGGMSGYYNHDNGTGAIRGIYLQGNEAVAPIFRQWMAPFTDAGMQTLTIRGPRDTDHVSFDEVGLPGFQFIQDPIEYEARTHHSSMDLFERIQESDLIQNATIIASFVYHTANREDRLPRKP